MANPQTKLAASDSMASTTHRALSVASFGHEPSTADRLGRTT